MIRYDNSPGFRSSHHFCIWHCASLADLTSWLEWIGLEWAGIDRIEVKVKVRAGVLIWSLHDVHGTKYIYLHFGFSR